MKNAILLIIFSLIFNVMLAQNEVTSLINKEVDNSISEYISLYKHLHQNPELSFFEFKTAERIKKELEDIGFELTSNFGGNSLVGVFKNGKGPVIMVRTDMDALPILEKTGLDFKSTVSMKNELGEEYPVMHACGHDMHMSVFIATANTMVKLKKYWSGTLLFIAQQAEEKSGGSSNMIKAGLFKKFPVPDYALAYHVSSSLPAGTIGYCSGATFAGVSSVDIKFKGVGGHGAYPHKTIDPIVMASQAILAFQTIVSREISPTDPAVVTVGSIHGGSQHNIIPDEVNLKLTIRSYKTEVEKQIIDALKRISLHTALSFDIPKDKLPEVVVLGESTPPVINNQDLLNKAVKSFEKIVGKENLLEVEAQMVGEDFGNYGLTEENIPILLSWLGSVPVDKYNEFQVKGEDLPALHSPFYYPDPIPTLKTGAKSMVQTLIDLMGK